MSQPELTFFCELESDALKALFADAVVIERLVALGAAVSLGVLDLSVERAAVVRRLNKGGVPVVAWLLLPQEQGYWFNLGNASQAVARYAAFRAWTSREGLRWAGVGLDVEPDIREMQQVLAHPRRLLPALVGRLFHRGRLHRAQAAYGALVDRIRADGYRVESYQFPFIVDERRAGSTLLRRAAGLVDVPADREVLMLYTSFLRPHGLGLLWSYAGDAGSVGVGSTGGGVQLEPIGDAPPLDWEAFSRDLRLARRRGDACHVFSLEGCVRQGFLARLEAFDWQRPVAPPVVAARRVEAARRALRTLLWLSARPLVLLSGALAGLSVVLWLRSRRRENGRDNAER